MRTEQFQRGDPVIFTKTKFSVHPGPRAEDIVPASHGDSYSYLVKKFWTVLGSEDGRVLVQTRTGKRYWVDSDNPAFRAPTWWEHFRYRERFPAISESEFSAEDSARDRDALNQS